MSKPQFSQHLVESIDRRRSEPLIIFDGEVVDLFFIDLMQGDRNIVREMGILRQVMGLTPHARC